ncbi:MAG: hypothetical protein RLZZ416_689 [Candidatus Parcubacteria bacterium]|jgi:methionine aminopeptidase
MIARMAKKGGTTWVTNEKIMGLLVDMDERMVTKEDLKDFATKDYLKDFATKEDLKSFATKEDLKDFATKEDLKNLATKGDLERVKEEILKPLEKAVDKDAETIVRHEKRMVVLERIE